MINSDISMKIFSYENVSKGEDLNLLLGQRSANSISYMIIQIYENMKFYDKNLTKTEEKVPTNTFSSPSLFGPVSKPGPKPKMKGY